MSDMLTTTIGQLVTERPSRARVFESFGLDYCCGGHQPLKEACQAKGINPQTVLNILNLLDERNSEPERDWSKATMTELCDHIEQTHHAYLRRELPRIEQLIAKVVNAHGAKHAHLAPLQQTFAGLKQELDFHMMKEERVLFPICRALDANPDEPPAMHCGTVDNPIRQMIHEHDDAGNALATMRQLTSGYTLPPDACNTYRTLYDALAELENDLHRHIHKENSILFPRASATERLCRQAAVGA
jgi:regulator of cell morphogenesis and NO signaling